MLIEKSKDGNGSLDPVITHFIADQSFPLVPRDDMIGQVPSLKKKFNDYRTYASATVNEIFSPDQLAKAVAHSGVS